MQLLLDLVRETLGRQRPDELFRFTPVSRQRAPDIALAVAVIVRDEAPYLEEWIEFHAMLGVGHFIVYDNGSVDGATAILERYAARGLVTSHPWPNLSGWNSQYSAMAHATLTWRERCRWMAFLDIDEFVFPRQGDSLVSALAPYESEAGVLLRWRNFGHGGHATRPPGLVTESFRFRMGSVPPHLPPRLASRIVKTKAIFDPCRVREISLHRPRTTGRLEQAGDDLLLNHYFTRSQAEFESKLRRGYGYKDEAERQAIAERTLAIREAVEFDPVEDNEIQRFVPALKARLAAR